MAKWMARSGVMSPAMRVGTKFSGRPPAKSSTTTGWSGGVAARSRGSVTVKATSRQTGQGQLVTARWTDATAHHSELRREKVVRVRRGN